MAPRFNTSAHKTRPAVALTTSPLATAKAKPDTRTALGAPGWTRTPKTALFLLTSGAFQHGKDEHHETGASRDDRLRQLVGEIITEDRPWLFEYAAWLRGPGNMRTAALMIAAEFVRESLDRGLGHDGLNRRIIDAVCQRPDEPGEMLAYWTSRYGRSVPKPVKRGLADAVRRMYNGKALLKWDSNGSAYRFGDVLNLVHATPDPDKPWQGDIFQYALDLRHHPDAAVVPESNHTLVARRDLMKVPVEQRRAKITEPGAPATLAAAGMTWEALAGWLQGPMDKAAWEAMIPTMPIMARLRNLRNFDQAGVSDTAAADVIDMLTDPEQIARSRQLPFRFLAAYRAVKEAGSLRWLYPLEQALNHSMANVPRLTGRTLILVDRSPSMFPDYDHMFPKSRIEGISRADQAAIFGCALAVRAEKAMLVEFGRESRVIPLLNWSSILPLVDQFGKIVGTDIPAAIKRHYDNHDRVIVLTDEQTRAGYFPSNMRYYGGMEETPIDALVPMDVPVYMWNFAGYTASAMPSGSNARFTLGGLTDQAFKLIPMLEAGAAGVWPWQEPQGD